jgi:hypothetical protein
MFGSGSTVLVIGALLASGEPTEGAGPRSAAAGRLPTQGDGRTETRTGPTSLEIEQIVLVDRQGRKRIRLAGEDLGPSIVLFDGKGKKRLELRIRDEIPAIALMDEKEEELATVQVVGDEASLLMGSRQGDRECPVALYSGQRKPGLYLRDNLGSPVASLTNERVGEAQLRLESAKGGTSLRADGVVVQDVKGHDRAMLALTNGNRPVIGLSALNQQGTPSMEMTVGDDGSRQFSMQNHSGFQLFFLGVYDKDRMMLGMRHPDAEGTLQISLGPKDEGGPTISCIAPATPGRRGTVLPKLELGLNRDCEPYLRMSDREGAAVFSAP